MLKRTLAHAQSAAAISGDPTPTASQMELKLVQVNGETTNFRVIFYYNSSQLNFLGNKIFFLNILFLRFFE